MQKFLKHFRLLMMSPILFGFSNSLWANNSCLVSPKDIQIAGVYLQQPVEELNSKLHFKIKKNTETTPESKEGYVEPLVYTWDSNDFPYVKDIDLGNLSFSRMGYNLNTNQISSFAFTSSDIGVGKEKLEPIFLKKTHIPLSNWVKSDETLNYKCDDYLLSIVENSERGEFYFAFFSKDSDEFNDYPKVKTVYHFSAKNLFETSTQKILLDEPYSGFDLYNNDSLFRSKLDRILFDKIGLKMEDFDMSLDFTPQTLNNPYVITEFYQKNKFFKNRQFTSYIAYNSDNNDMLVFLTDDKDGIYVLGDKDKYLIKALKKYQDFPEEYYSYLD